MTTEHMPLVTIITASYNSSKTIRDTLTSVAEQDYPNVEHIVIDGQSTDQTMDIVREFSHVSHVISERDQGIYDAMNKGIILAKGEIIGILNSDDFYVSKNVLSSIVQQMQKEKSSALYADLVYVHPLDTKRILRTWIAGKYNVRKFLFGWMPPHPTFFVRRSVYQQYGPFNISLKSAADYELMLRLLYKEKISVSYLPQVLVKMRSGGMSNASMRNRFQANREDRQAWRGNFFKPSCGCLRKE